MPATSVKRMMTLRYPVLLLLLVGCLLCPDVANADTHPWGPSGGHYQGGSSSSGDNNGWVPWDPTNNNNNNNNNGGLPSPSPSPSPVPSGGSGTGDGNSGNNNNHNNGGSGSDIGTGTGSGSGTGYGQQYGSGSGSPGFDVQAAMRLREVHGILAAVAIVGLFPLGAVLVRVVPGRFAWLAHALTQTLAYVTFVGAAVLGFYLVRMVRIGPEQTSLLKMASTNAHPILGIVILVLLTAQPALGLVHHARYKRLGRRTLWSHAHVWLGRAAVTLGVVNGGLGLRLARAGRPAVAAYAVVAAAVWLLWIGAALWGEARLRKQQRRRGGDGGGGRLRGGGGDGGGGGDEDEAKALAPASSDGRAAAAMDGSTIGGNSNSRGGGSGGGGGGGSVSVGGGDGSTVMATLGSSNTTGYSVRSNMSPAEAAHYAHGDLHDALTIPYIAAARRPETPSPPYTPGPAGAGEWTVYGGPGLNNTPFRGNRAPEEVAEVSPIEPEKS